jgi:hypothetical protein
MVNEDAFVLDLALVEMESSHSLHVVRDVVEKIIVLTPKVFLKGSGKLLDTMSHISPRSHQGLDLSVLSPPALTKNST